MTKYESMPQGDAGNRSARACLPWAMMFNAVGVGALIQCRADLRAVLEVPRTVLFSVVSAEQRFQKSIRWTPMRPDRVR